jgi:hypothetical protein
MVNEHKLRYLAASKVEKPKVAREVVQLWRAQNPPGRFLTRKDDSRKGPGSVKAEGNIWFDVGDKKAREKASQCLRERTPDVIPFVREMQRQQDFLTGHGLRYVEQQMISNSNSSASSPHLHSNSEPAEVANAFSQEYFASNGFNNAGGGFNNAPRASNQMTQEEQWQMFQGMSNNSLNTNNLAAPTTLFPDSQPSGPNHAFNHTAGIDMNPPDADELTLDEYTKSMEEFLQRNNSAENADLPADMRMRTKTLETLKQDSWVKSFYAVETTKDDHDTKKTPRKTNKENKKSSLENTIQRQNNRSTQALQLAGQGMSTRTELTAGTQMTNGSKMSTLSHAFSAMSGVSMFSELSDESRAHKMDMARGLSSNLSMMSELTDLSESLKSLDLATGHSKNHY